MTLSFMLRMLYAYLWMLTHGANINTCTRVWDMDPSSTLPPTRTYEEWYGSPELVCSTGEPEDDRHRSFIFCYGPNC